MLRRRAAKDLRHACKMMTQIGHSFASSQYQLVDRFGISYGHWSKSLDLSPGPHSNMLTRCLLKCRHGNNGQLKLVRRLPCFPDPVCHVQKSLLSWRYRFYGAVIDECSDGDSGFVCEGKKPATVAVQSPRSARKKAQKALMDYLHGTRALDFVDAEHISKNSPGFVTKLLRRVGDEEDAGSSIRRFLRYNPINEFEPFFESLGVKELELPDVLPLDLMFLSDDWILLRGFRLLCNYGVPRSRIGKMYLEASEIFRYEPEVLTAQLEAYEQLGLDSPTVVKLVSCCPTLLVGSDGVDKEFMSVFESLKDMGFRYYWITRCLTESNTYHWGKMRRMLEFLDEMGCSKEDVKSLITMHPWFLFNESGKKVYVVTAILLKLGLKMKNILLLLVQNPQILSGSFVKNLHQSIQFLSEIGMEGGEIANIICSHPNAMGRCMLKKSRSVLSSEGLDRDELRDIIVKDPTQLALLASKTKMTTILATCNRYHPLEKTDFLLKLGFVESSDEMVAAQSQFRGRGDQLQERFEILVNAGLNFQDACNLVKEAPQILNQTVDVLKKKIDYLVNCAGYPLNSIVTFPTYLCYNMDKIKTRLLMLEWLKKKGAVKPKLALSSVIAVSSARFERCFVNLLPEGPEVWKNLNK